MFDVTVGITKKCEIGVDRVWARHEERDSATLSKAVSRRCDISERDNIRGDASSRCTLALVY